MELNRFSLDAWRVERGLTLTQLAEASGYDRTTVGKIIAGTRVASPGFIHAAAAALGVDVRVLVVDPARTQDRSAV